MLIVGFLWRLFGGTGADLGVSLAANARDRQCYCKFPLTEAWIPANCDRRIGVPVVEATVGRRIFREGFPKVVPDFSPHPVAGEHHERIHQAEGTSTGWSWRLRTEVHNYFVEAALRLVEMEGFLPIQGDH
jgi:hypothetical protein